MSACASAPGSSNSRCLTIANDSTDDAGRHWSAIRWITCCSRARACAPFSPPTSMSVAPRSVSSPVGAADDAGMDTTSSAPGTALTTSVSVCANVNCVSNVPPARSSRP